MSPPRTNTREGILDTAVALIQERGYNAFSYHHVSDALGIKNAAVHYHFPSKADLGLAVVKRYHRQFDDWVAAQRDEGAGPLALLRGYFLIPMRFVRDGGKVCPLGVLEAEYKAIPDPMRQAVRELDADIRRFLADVLEQGRHRGVFRFDGDAADKALVIVAALQGGLQIARAAGYKAVMRVIRQTERDLGVEEAR